MEPKEQSQTKSPVEDDQKYYDYLDTLNRAGYVNMLGAHVQLQNHYNMDLLKASKLLNGWLRTHKAPKPKEQPATDAKKPAGTAPPTK